MRNKPRWDRLRLREEIQFSAFVLVPVHQRGARFERGRQIPQAQATSCSKLIERVANWFYRLEFSPAFQQGEFV